MTDFLKTMAAASRERADRVGRIASSALERPVATLDTAAFGIIAEIKARSPAEGSLAIDVSRTEQARRYADAGAAAISVLTEPGRFDGALSHLDEIAAALPGVPVMRKDFLVDTCQVTEARAAGASGVLLIVAMLEESRLRAMLDAALEYGMFVLLEAFDGEDVTRLGRVADDYPDAAAASRLLFGVNTRNLRTLAVDPNRLARLADGLPSGVRVAESGLRTAADAAAAARLGYGMALVGTALMRADDPGALIGSMQDAAREALAA